MFCRKWKIKFKGNPGIAFIISSKFKAVNKRKIFLSLQLHCDRHNKKFWVGSHRRGGWVVRRTYRNHPRGVQAFLSASHLQKNLRYLLHQVWNKEVHYFLHEVQNWITLFSFITQRRIINQLKFIYILSPLQLPIRRNLVNSDILSFDYLI